MGQTMRNAVWERPLECFHLWKKTFPLELMTTRKPILRHFCVLQQSLPPYHSQSMKQYACALKIVMGLLWKRFQILIFVWLLHAPFLPHLRHYALLIMANRIHLPKIMTAYSAHMRGYQATGMQPCKSTWWHYRYCGRRGRACNFVFYMWWKQKRVYK